MDLDKALLDPASEFSSLADVVSDQSLSRDQKVKILERWEYDARELQVAEEENMAGGPGNQLDDVLAALNSLGARHNPNDSAPTKQGGD